MPKTTKHGGVRQDPAVSRPTGDSVSRLSANMISGDEAIGGTLAVTGAVTAASTLDVTGTVTAFGYLGVGGNAGVTGALDVAGSNSGIWGPRDNALIGASSDPAMCPATGLTLTGGTIYLTKIPIARAATPTKLYWYVTAQAVTATPSQCWVGVLSSAGTLLGTSVDVATASESTGLKSTTVAPGALTPGFVWGAIVLAGSTVGTVAIAPGSTLSTLTNAGLAAATLRYATNGTGQTTLTTRTPGSNTAGPSVWMALGA